MRDQGPILIPLDGSALAEGALPYAAALARALEERIAVVCVWEGNESGIAAALPAVAMEVEAGAREYFARYLRTIEARNFGGVPVEASFREGDAAREIENAAAEFGARAIVLATHGRSGVGRWIYGSVASRVLRDTRLPVMAVGPHALQRDGSETHFKHIMVPLDGTPLSEAALPLARTLMERTGARVSLVRAVRWAVQTYPYTLPDAYVPQIDDELEKGAKTYLQRKETELGEDHVRAFVVRGGVAEGMLDLIEKEAVDLVVMTTHGRAGIARAALGSTADRLIQGSAPVLLIRPEQD
jgi:nucleotide-binding universal stress UspA family protein